MLAWLKRLFRRRPPAAPPISPEIRHYAPGDDAPRLSVAIAAAGLRLQCRDVATGDIRLVSAGECADPRHFSELWSRYNTASLYWEDGTPYTPGG